MKVETRFTEETRQLVMAELRERYPNDDEDMIEYMADNSFVGAMIGLSIAVDKAAAAMTEAVRKDAERLAERIEKGMRGEH